MWAWISLHFRCMEVISIVFSVNIKIIQKESKGNTEILLQTPLNSTHSTFRRHYTPNCVWHLKFRSKQNADWTWKIDNSNHLLNFIANVNKAFVQQLCLVQNCILLCAICSNNSTLDHLISSIISNVSVSNALDREKTCQLVAYEYTYVLLKLRQTQNWQSKSIRWLRFLAMFKRRLTKFINSFDMSQNSLNLTNLWRTKVYDSFQQQATLWYAKCAKYKSTSTFVMSWVVYDENWKFNALNRDRIDSFFLSWSINMISSSVEGGPLK